MLNYTDPSLKNEHHNNKKVSKEPPYAYYIENMYGEVLL